MAHFSPEDGSRMSVNFCWTSGVYILEDSTSLTDYRFIMVLLGIRIFPFSAVLKVKLQ
jgi:hypothetical protein